MERSQVKVQRQKPQRRQRRQRPALSCWECRRRKIKCDRNTPCAHCARHGSQCTYKLHGDVNQPISRTSDNHDTIVLPCEVSPAQTEQTLQALTATFIESASPVEACDYPGASGASGASTNSRSATVADTHTRKEAQECSDQLPSRIKVKEVPRVSNLHFDDLVQRVRKLEEALSRRGDSSNTLTGIVHARLVPEDVLHSSLAQHTRISSQFEPPGWQVVLNKSRDLGRSRRMGEAPEFDAIIAIYKAIIGKSNQDLHAQDLEISLLIKQAGEFNLSCKNLARRLKIGRPSKGLAPVSTTQMLDTQLTPPSREVADAMTNLYFECFESTHRILHVPTFWVEYSGYWEHPHSATNDLRLKLLLVVAIGSSVYDHGDSNAVLRNAEVVEPWIYAAETWLAGPLEKSRLSISGIQIYCLTIIVRQIFSVGGDLVWMSMGSLVHRAMQMGFHREPKCLLAGMPVLQTELRRRLWATILDLVVQASLDAWMPPRISFDEFDVEPPSNINDDEMDETTTEITPHPRTAVTSTSIQLALYDTLPVRLRIVQHLNGLHPDKSYSRVLALSSELIDALRICSSLSMVKERDKDQSHITVFHHSLLDFLIRRFMIPLHLFFSNQARSNPPFHYSLKLSLDAAFAIITSITTVPPAEHNPNDGAFLKLLTTSGGLFRQGFRNAITAISLELLSHLSTQQQDGTLHRASQYRDLLKQKIRDLLALSEQRIRCGETNVKSYMFLAMILAQVEAVEAGVEMELAIAKNARDSLQFCHEILSTRAADVSLASSGAGREPFDNTLDDMSTPTPDSMGFENIGLDWDWESCFPNADFS